MAYTLTFDRLYDLQSLADAINSVTFDNEIKILHNYLFRFNDADVEIKGYVHGTFEYTDATFDTPPWVDLIRTDVEIDEIVVYKYSYSYELPREEINELEMMLQ